MDNKKEIVSRLRDYISRQGLQAFTQNAHIANVVAELVWEYEPERRLFYAAFSQAPDRIAAILNQKSATCEPLILELQHFLVNHCCLGEERVCFFIDCIRQLCEPAPITYAVCEKGEPIEKRVLVLVGKMRGIGAQSMEVCMVSGSKERYVVPDERWEEVGVVSLSGVPSDTLSVRYQYVGTDEARTRENPGKHYTLWKKWKRAGVGILHEDGAITYKNDAGNFPTAAVLCEADVAIYAYATRLCGFQTIKREATL